MQLNLTFKNQNKKPNRDNMTRINLNSENSKLIGDKVFITALKAHKAQEGVNYKNSIIHPILGRMYEYGGMYARK